MKIVLQNNVDKLGQAGDVVDAAPGYFRNYLQPRGLAVKATAGTLKKREEDLEILRKKAQTAHEAAVSLGEKIDGLAPIRVIVKAGDSGKLYGKVTTRDIAEELKKRLEVEIDKRTIKPIMDVSVIGAYEVKVRVSAEVEGKFVLEAALDESMPVAPVVLPGKEKLAEMVAEEEAAAEAAAAEKLAQEERLAAKAAEEAAKGEAEKSEESQEAETSQES